MLMRGRIGLSGFLAICAAIEPGCLGTQRAIETAALRPQYRLVVHERGAIVSEREVAPGSSEEQVIARWLQAHETGWRIDINTYAPGRQIEGDSFDLNFAGRICVLNYDRTGKGDRVQVSRTVEESDALPDLFKR